MYYKFAGFSSVTPSGLKLLLNAGGPSIDYTADYLDLFSTELMESASFYIFRLICFIGKCTLLLFLTIYDYLLKEN